MSILCETEDVLVVSHQCFLNNVYNNVQNNNSVCSYIVNPIFFSTEQPYKVISDKCRLKKKQHKNNENINTLYVLNTFKKAQILIKRSVKCCCCPLERAGSAKDLADNFYKESSKRLIGNIKGGNNSMSNILVKINGEEYFIPRGSLFFNFNVQELKNHVNEVYDLIVLDPPWWNKFIRRKRAKCNDCYSMLANSDLSELPINGMLKEDGLVAIWCTNAESHYESLQNEIFPAWGLNHVATWFWMKVTTEGEPVTSFSPANGKQPFEKLIFACRNPFRPLPLPQKKKLLVSVPSSIHSHKPPLCDIIKPYLPSNPNCLEIFARYLLPNWTSYGNEVLKLQHISFFAEGKNS